MFFVLGVTKMKSCLTLSLFILLLQMEATSTQGNQCCYNEKRITKQFWRFPEHKYINERTGASPLKWPTPLIFYDVDPHMDPVLKHYVAKAIIYMNTGGDNILLPDEQERHANDEPDTTCIFWYPRVSDGSHDYMGHYWVTFFQANGNESRWALEADAGSGYGKPYPESNTHLYVGHKHAQEILFGSTLKSDGVGVQIFFETGDPGKTYTSLILHEMMHVMGFIHEHQRRDRDCWIFVSHSLIAAGADTRYTYDVIREFLYSGLFPYDLHSVMHYSKMRDIYPHNRTITYTGRIDGGISDMDWRKINYLYCGKKPDCQPKSLTDKCAKDIESYGKNPNCFREGKAYGKTPTCAPC